MTVIEVFGPVQPAGGADVLDRPAYAIRTRRLAAPAAVTGSPVWRWVVLTVAAMASVATTVIVHLSGHAALWGDEPSHLLRGRRLFDAVDPGFGQLGNYWPPLIHWAEVPFVWNDWLYRTGLAGQIPAMLMFLAAAAGAFALGVELSGRRRIGALAALVIIANPNMLFLQSAAMMESGIVMTLTWVAVWLLRFRRTGRFRDLVIAGAWSFLAVFATWAALVLPLYGAAIVVPACRRNGFAWDKTRAYTAAYAVFSGYGVLLWLGWNWYLQDDPLYMITYRHAPSLSDASGPAGLSQLSPDLPRGLLSMGSALLDNVGPAVFVLSVLVLVVGVLRGRLLHPLGVTLLGGALVVAEWARGQGGLSGSPTFAWLNHLHGPEATGLNIRYALWLLPFTAGAVAVAAGRARWRQAAVLVLVLVSAAWFLPGLRGVVTTRSGDMLTAADETHAVQVADRVRAAFHGGVILTSASAGGDREIWLSRLSASDFVTEDDSATFARALKAPGAHVQYVLSTKSLRDQLSDATLTAAGFSPRWTVVVAGDPQTFWVLDGPGGAR